jgi:hypothetical protein
VRNEVEVPMRAELPVLTIKVDDSVMVVSGSDLASSSIAALFSSRFTARCLTAAAVIPAVAEEETLETAFPVRELDPSNVTSAFSASQLRPPVLKRARIVSPTSGIEKLACACDTSRGIASPRVALENVLTVSDEELPAMVAVVQPSEPSTVQSEPVKPFTQIQAHASPVELVVTMFVPPFAHVVVAWHCESEVWASDTEVEVFGLLNTRSSRGTTTAAATMRRMTNRSIMKAGRGMPQQRRFFLPSPFLARFVEDDAEAFAS